MFIYNLVLNNSHVINVWYTVSSVLGWSWDVAFISFLLLCSC